MKKIFVIFLLTAFCFNTTAFAVNDTAGVDLKDVFENNYQNLSESSTTPTTLSAIEKMFNGKESSASGNILHQVGYDQFTSPSTAANSATGKYDGSYRLGIGEKVNIYSYGDAVDIMAMSATIYFHL